MAVTNVVDTVVVLAAGRGSPPAASIPIESIVVAADGGADLALTLGAAVDVFVGDFDSISPAALDLAQRGGRRVDRHAREKDATDLELAFDVALTYGPRRILLLGAGAGRLDHLLGELSLLGAEAYAGVEVDAVLGMARIHVVRRERLLSGIPGELISLLPLHGPAVGVVADGLLYPVHGETLPAGSSRGISNVFTAETVRIGLERGVLLAVRPGDEPLDHGSAVHR